MDIKEFCDLIKRLSNYSELFVSDNIKNMMQELGEFASIIDARSLAFFTLGKEQVNKDKKCTSCIINSNELASTLTAITEARYKQKKLIIMTIGNKICIDPYIDVTDKVIQSNEIEYIENKIKQYNDGTYFKPLLINIEMDFEPKERKSNVISILLNGIKDNEKIYTNLKIDNIENLEKLVKWENDYGVISRYLGNLVVNKDENLYLVTSYDSFCKDINTFYSRYINEKVVILFVKDKNEQERFNIENWTTKNEIDYKKIEDEKELEELNLSSLKTKTIVEILI